MTALQAVGHGAVLSGTEGHRQCPDRQSPLNLEHYCMLCNFSRVRQGMFGRLKNVESVEKN